MAGEKAGNAEAFALASALGSLTLLGGFLIVDGFVNMFRLVEDYTKTSTWTLIAAVPFVVLTYLLGLFVELFSSAIFPRLMTFLATRSWELTEQDDFLVVANLGNESMMQRYSALVRDRKLLDGAAVPLLLLACGAFSEKERLMREVGRSIGPVITLIGVVALAGAFAAPIAAHLKGKAAKNFAGAAAEKSRAKDTQDTAES
jgi:hypothetical protein